MPDSTNLSEAKRALLEKMLQGNLPQTRTTVGAIPRRSQDGPIPLSFMQQQFWLLSQLSPNTPAYNQGLDIRLPGPLIVSALQQSLDEIIRRHEAWRTSFPLVDGQPVQRIHPPSALPLPVVDLQHLAKAEGEAEGLRLAQDLVNQPFDLSQAPPLRALLVRLKETEHHLFLVVHHSITDGFSDLEILLPELQALYQAYLTGQPSPLPELDIQYADYALWQRETLQGETLEHLLSFWKQCLAQAPTELALPTDHPRPLTPSGQGAAYPFILPKQLSDALQALSQREGTTLFTTLLAAFAILLARYSSQEDILIGTPSSGRARPEVQKLLGVFVNTLPIRIRLSGNPSFRALLKQSREAALAALAHEQLPFEQLVRHLQPERTLGQNPFIQVVLSLQPPAYTHPQGWSISPMLTSNDLGYFDLSLDLREHPEGLHGSLEYKTDLFEATTIERMLGHWQTLLEGIVADPDQPIATLPLLTEAERQQLLVDQNPAQADFPQDQCLHQIFEQQAASTPEAIAVIFEGNQLTYRELNERANQLAHYLRQLGVGPESLVGLCVERSLNMAVGVMGVLKAGGAYVPLDPNYPQERLAFILEDAHATILLTQQHLLERLPLHRAKTVCLDSNWERIAQESPTNPANINTKEHLAYVIYTSGSTGKPKGVLIPHQALVNHNLACITRYDLQPTDRVLQFASLSFDVAAEELFPTWLCGAAVVLRPAGFALTPTELLQLAEDQRLTILNLPTAYWHAWVQDLANTTTPLPETLRLVIVGGEQAQPQYLALWQQRVDPRVRWVNGYGPTEATITATTYDLIRTGEEQVITSVPIGRPLPNTLAYVLDRQRQPVPVGVTGELYLGGVSLARGYLNRPDITAEKFIDNPFSHEPGARLYRTGDLVRWKADGNLEYLGRIDQQVKIRGFRIELGEIEAVLTQHPYVREGVVVAREDTLGEKRLVAYVVSANDQPLSASDLRNFLQERLPSYMIPAFFVFLETLPLNTSGKVERKALPSPEESRTQEEFVAPHTLTEEMLAQIWRELLGRKQVGITDNFFDLGGHSLLAVRLLAQVNATFQVELPLSSIFEQTTIQGLAARIEASIFAKLEMMDEEELTSFVE